MLDRPESSDIVEILIHHSWIIWQWDELRAEIEFQKRKPPTWRIRKKKTWSRELFIWPVRHAEILTTDQKQSHLTEGSRLIAARPETHNAHKGEQETIT